MTEFWVPLLIGVVLPIGIMGGVLLQDRLYDPFAVARPLAGPARTLSAPKEPPLPC